MCVLCVVSLSVLCGGVVVVVVVVVVVIVVVVLKQNLGDESSHEVFAYTNAYTKCLHEMPTSMFGCFISGVSQLPDKSSAPRPTFEHLPL